MIKNPVLGAIIGDIVGVPYEFLKYEVAISPDFPLFSNNSTFSDDTVMTLAVADWLLKNSLDSNDLIKCMQKLAQKYPNRKYGRNFRHWLRDSNPQPYNSFGNGSAMRVSPVGCAFSTLDKVLDIAEQTASVSHNHPEGIKGAQATAEFIWLANNNFIKDYNSIKSRRIEEKYNYNLHRTPKEIIDSGYMFDVSCQGSVPEAICCFLNSSSYEETIRNAVLLRGDADTQACIAGAIAAAHWGIPEDIAKEGLKRLPEDLLEILENFSKEYNLELN